jgi:phage terminase large subunit
MDKNQAEAIRKLRKASKISPPFFNEWILGGSFWSKQEEIILSVRDNRYTTVRACHDVGKTYIASRTALWFLYSHPQSIVVTTAPTMRQVENLLWRELRAAHEASRQPLGGEPLKTRLDIAPDWYAIGASSGDPDKLQGFHAASGDILIIIDEAAGVNEDAFEAIEGMMTSEKARMLMIGNPTSDSGSFRASHHSWTYANKIHISVFDTPNFVENGIKNVDDLREAKLDKVDIVSPYLVSPRWAQEKIDTWGIDSPMFQARVLGNFPSQSVNTIIPLNYLELAYEKERVEKIKAKGGPLRIGVDPARFGNDETVITPRYGGYIPKQEIHSKEDTQATAGRVLQYRSPRPVFIGIDVDGLGGGVYDKLNDEKIDGIAEIYNNGKALPDATGLTFANLASQLWWRAREMFIAGELAIPKDDKLIMQLSTRRYKFTGRGLTVESKDDWKARFKGKSPDRADSLIYSLADILSTEREARASTGRDTSSKIKDRMRE